MVEETKAGGTTGNQEQESVVYSNRKKPDHTVPLFLNDGTRLEVGEESCCSAHSTLVSDQNTTFTAVKLHGKAMTLKGTRLDTWPVKTEVSCWYDTFPFTTVPVPLVHHYDQQKKAFVIYGNVCSVQCGLAYMHRENRRHDLWERIVLFEDMMQKVFNKKIVGCEPAPPFLTLTRFGGFFSIEEYRASFNNIIMTVIAPPFLMYPLVIQEKHHLSTDTNEVVHDETVLSTGHVLRGLRRPQKALTTSPGPGETTSVISDASMEPKSVILGPLTVPALDSDSSSDGEVPESVVMDASIVPPLSNVQMDTEFYNRLAKSTKMRGRGRGRGSGSSRSQFGMNFQRGVSPAPTNNMLTSFLINK